MNEENSKPYYANYDSAEKFSTIEAIIIQRLKFEERAICSYSGGSDSDILIDLIEGARRIFPDIPPVKYVFFNTGLEMDATKRHVKETEQKYGITIEEIKPNINIVRATRMYGQPFMSKAFSRRLQDFQEKKVPLSIYDEYWQAEDKAAKLQELKERYPKSACLICSILGVTAKGKPSTNKQLSLSSAKYFFDFLQEYPPDFKISAKCCDFCKKNPAHEVQKNYNVIITGEREAEGGERTISAKILDETETKCFYTQKDGKKRFRPLYYVTDKDKAWYKEKYGIRYSDAYEVYGLTRTGCCGCPISYKAVEDLKKIEPYEPNLVRAAWNIFGDSYRYRQEYNEFKAKKRAEEKNK